MKIEARHVRRKQLQQYLDVDFLKNERNLSETSINSLYSTQTSRKRPSTDGITSPISSKKGKVNDSVSEPQKKKKR